MNKVVDTTYHFAAPAIKLTRKEMIDLIKNTNRAIVWRDNKFEVIEIKK